MNRLLRLDPSIFFAAIVPDGGQLIRRHIFGEPLLDRELLLSAGPVDPSQGGFHVVDVPAGVSAGTVGGQVEAADRGGQARCSAAEDVKIAPLEVVVVGAHQAAPRLDIRDLEVVTVAVVQPDADDGVGPASDDGSSPNVQRVHAILASGDDGEGEEEER